MMKKRLLIIFGMIACWVFSHAQAPDLIYYRFEDSTHVTNYATDPVGWLPASISGSAYISQNGFLGTGAYADTGGPKSPGGVRTGWNTRIDGSFTVSFWYYNPDTVSGASQNYLFGDSTAQFNCVSVTFNGNLQLLFLIEGFPAMNWSGSAYVPHVVHLVYDHHPKPDTPFGTYSLYVDGVLQKSVNMTAPVDIIGSGLVLGRNQSNLLVVDNLYGMIDEFRWYGRALTATEVGNTHDIDITPLGDCSSFSSFTMDSISGTAAKIDWTPGSGNTSYFLEYDTAGFVPGTGNVLTGTYPADPSKVVLSGLSPETEYDIYFGELCGGGDSVYNRAPYTFLTSVLCQIPTDMEASGITTTSADIHWSYIGPLQESYLIYGPLGFDPQSSGSRDTSFSTSYTLTGLDPGTRYDVYLFANCGPGNGSSDTIKTFFTTDCEVFVAPFFEDFEDSTWVPRVYPSFHTDTINACWTRTPSWMESGQQPNRIFNWGVRTGRPSSSAGPLTGKGGGGNYLCSDRAITSKVGDETVIYSPFIDISSLNNPYLKFFYHRYGATTPDLYVEVNDGSGWTNVMTMKGPSQTVRTDPYDSTGVDISSFGNVVQVRFRAILTGSGSYMGLDDFEIGEAPPLTCLSVSEIFNTGAGQDTAVTIDVMTSGYYFGFEWGPPGFDQGTGCIGYGTAPFTIDGCLELNSVYELYVQNNCQDSGLGVSPWTGPFEFCTPATAPYSIDFDHEAPGGYAGCWEQYSKASVGVSNQGTEVYTYYEQAFSGFNILRIYDNFINNDDTVMSLSPRFIDLPEGDKQIRFVAFAPSKRTGKTGGTTGTPYEDMPRELVVGTMSSYYDGASFNPIDTLILSKHGWEEFIVELDPATTPYNGTDQLIALRYISRGNASTTDFCYIDNFHYEEIPDCSAPDIRSLQAVFITDNTAKINWLPRSSGSVQVEWGSKGYEPGSADALGSATSSDTTHTISGLAASTSYDAYIRVQCAGGSYTYWVGPLSFTTACSLISAPYFEDFNGPEWYSPSRFLNALNCGDSISQCWSRVTTCHDIYTWGVANSSNCPSQDNGGGGNFIFNVVGAGDTFADIYSPVIELSALSKPYLSFYYHRSGLNTADLAVQVNDGDGTWHTVITLTGEQQNSCTDPFRRAGTDISSFGDTLQLRFRVMPTVGYASSFKAEMGIDDIRIDEALSCLAPENLSAGHIIDTTVEKWSTTLSWEDFSGLASEYEVWWGYDGFYDASTPGTGYRDVVSGLQYTIDSLHPGVCYEFLVRSICGAGDSSNFEGPYTFCAPCAPKEAPYTHPFFTGQSLTPGSDCWIQEFTDRTFGGYKWLANSGRTRSVFPGNPVTTGPEDGVYGSDYLFVDSRNGDDGDSVRLYSPIVKIKGLSRPQMSFYYHMFGSDIDTLRVDLFDGLQWYDDVVILAGQQQGNSTDPWKDTIVDLRPFSGTGFIQARFSIRKDGFTGDASIDEFRVSDSVSCPYPFNFRAEDISMTEAQLMWSGSAAEDHIIEYGPAGYTYGQGTEVVVSGDSVIIPVSDNRRYEAYLRTVCTPGDTSYLIGPLTFYSKVAPCDDLEVYAPGPLDDQSTLFRPWDATAPDSGYGIDGDDEISGLQASSGTQSLRLYEGPNGGAGILAETGELNSGIYSVGFDILITDTGGAFYELLTRAKSNTSGFSIASGLLYFNKVTNRCEVSYTGSNLGSFPFSASWNEVRHIMDFDRDTTWMVVNGSDVHIGWKIKSNTSEPYPRLQGVHFVTTPDNINTSGKASEFFLDDFCAETFICSPPTGLTLDENTCEKIMIHWENGIDSSQAVIEYGVSGFTRGMGVFRSVSFTHDTLTGLVPGTTYDIYVGEVCGYDTVFSGPLTVPMPTEAVADFIFTKENPTPQDIEVHFDAGNSDYADHYFWSFGDGDTASGEQVSHVYDQNGTYDVKLIIESDCGRDTLIKTVVVTGISIRENIISRTLQIYPNPFGEVISLRFETGSSGDVSVYVTDLSGKTVVQEVLSGINGSFNGELRLGTLARGSYLLRIESGGLSAVKRVIRR